MTKLRLLNYNAKNYNAVEFKKSQIYLHHTAGSYNADNVFAGWDRTNKKIGTCVAISGPSKNSTDGEIVQGFHSKFWAHHLGIPSSVFKQYGVNYSNLERTSIGIEICSFGQLFYKEGKYLNYLGQEIPEDQVEKLPKPYKGFNFFHRYTDAQIESVIYLLKLWRDRYGIPLEYREKDMFEVSVNALKNVPGLYTHNSVRRDKIDIYPCPRLIEALIKI